MVEASSNIKADKASALENRPRFERLR
jgi:leucyl-tRNA synthetase